MQRPHSENGNDARKRIAANWRSVNELVAEAASRANRTRESIQVIGVSKYVDAETTAMLYDAGCRDLGESRAQTLWQKAESLKLPSDARWHMIGHLQTNKVRRLLRHPVMVHSLDSERLLQKIIDETVQRETPVEILIEVNISGDEAKTGLRAADIRRLFETAATNQHAGFAIVGLMAMAGWGTKGTDARKQFAALRELRDSLNTEFDLSLDELSMGMSGDFSEAIAEGATMVRIGSALFEGVR